MSVTPNQIVIYGSANMPEADGVTVGGAYDPTILVSFADLTANDTVDWVSSSSSDTAVKAQISGRDAAGIIQTPSVVTLNGTTKVTGAQTFQRLLYGIITGSVAGSFPLVNPGGSTAVGDVACLRHSATIGAHTAQTGSANTSGTTPPLFKLQSGDGSSVSAGMIIQTTGGTGPNQLRRIIATSGYGTDVVAVDRDWGTVPDNTTTYNVNVGILFPVSPNPITKVVRAFSTAAADVPSGSTRYYFEKVFAVNTNTTVALTSAQAEIASDSPSLPGSALLDMALCTALNDTNTCNPRQQISSFVPTGSGAFVTQPSLISLPGSGNLAGGSAPNSANAQGIWLRLTLPAAVAAYDGATDLRVQGQTV